LITFLHDTLLERSEEANKIKESYFVHNIETHKIEIGDIGILENIRNRKIISLESEKNQDLNNAKNLVFPIDMNLHNNDYSQKLLEGISQNIRNVQNNMQTSMKELKEQGQGLKQAHFEVNQADEEMNLINANINEISSKRKCQIVLMYITATALFFVIMLLLVFKFMRA